MNQVARRNRLLPWVHWHGRNICRDDLRRLPDAFRQVSGADNS